MPTFRRLLLIGLGLPGFLLPCGLLLAAEHPGSRAVPHRTGQPAASSKIRPLPATNTQHQPAKQYQRPETRVAVQAGVSLAQQSQFVPAVEPINRGPAVPDASAVTLDELVQVAYQNNPTLRQAVHQVAAARGQAIQAGLYPNPLIGTGSPQLAGDASQYNVFMTQEIVTHGKIALESQAAWRRVREEQLQMIRTRFDVLTELRTLYFNALAAQRRVEVLEDLVAISRKSQEAGQRLFQGGEASRTDFLLLDVEYDRAQIQLENAVTLLEASKRQLAAATGLPGLPIGRLAGNLMAELPPYDLICVQQGVITRNALAAMAQVQVSRSRLQLARAQVEPLPNLTFTGGYQYSANPEEPHNQGLYELTMVVPLWDRNQGNIRAAQANVGAAVAQLGRVRSELAGEAAAAVGRYLTARQQVERYEAQILPKAQESQRLTQQLYTEGQLDFLRVLQSQRTLIEAQLAYISALEAQWTAAAEVAGLLQSETFPDFSPLALGDCE